MSEKELNNDKIDENVEKGHLIDKIEAAGQIILGEIELIGGALTGDPMTQAEGEFNIEAGTIETEMASDLEDSESAETASGNE